jgi:3-oxoacyl-[acyl-carrier protein] reductase
MNSGLAGRRALVGGASSGLGLATAHALAAEGCHLLLWARNMARLQKVADELKRAHGVQVHTVSADSRHQDASATVAERVQETFGGVDVLVLNTGGPPFVDSFETTPQDWRAALQALMVTPVDIATRLLPGMRGRGYGRIIAILSTTVREPAAGLSYSSGARSALAAWLKTIARDVAIDGVTVNGVLAGLISTPRLHALAAAMATREATDAETVSRQGLAAIPAGRFGAPEELAAVVTFLASAKASYVTGGMIPCDGGILRGHS